MCGEVGWRLESDGVYIQGAVTWPIAANPISMRFGMLRGSLHWKRPGRPRNGGYSFVDTAELCGFLHDLADSVAARGICVEAEAPHAISQMRYERFRRSAGLTMPNIDWIFGLRADDPQHAKMESGLDACRRVIRRNDFTIFVLKDDPFDYDSPDDLERLAHVESILGLS